MGSSGFRLLIAVVAVALLAGCTTTSTGDPAPVDSSSDPGPSTSSTPSETDPGNEDLPFAGAPKVDNPLDTGTFQDDPCQSLTSSQSGELNVGPSGQPIEAPLGNACEWRNDETHGYVQITFNDDNPVGLSGEYRANEQGKFAYFDELEVDGYPAVSNDVVDRRPRGICVVVVGVSDEIGFVTSLQLSQANVGQTDPCDKAAEVAGMALQTMKQGG
jgi:hypothetical protein